MGCMIKQNQEAIGWATFLADQRAPTGAMHSEDAAEGDGQTRPPTRGQPSCYLPRHVALEPGSKAKAKLNMDRAV
eukprot:2947214-Pyramimonas_sp.AAC.2